LWCFRRGWTVKWLPLLLISLALSAAPGEARAASWNWIDLFATHDQQGRWSFEHGDYKSAAQRFDDPVWKGRAQYLAGDYRAALESFSRLRTPEAYFYIGNTLAHLKDYAGAVLAYDNALREQPAFADAASNRDLMKQLLAREKTQPEDDEDAQQPDRTKTGKKSDKGQRVMVHEARPAEDVWMRNLNTSPAAFLHQRFQQEAGGTP
jgi:Ca-activated chloride channel family protein